MAGDITKSMDPFAFWNVVILYSNGALGAGVEDWPPSSYLYRRMILGVASVQPMITKLELKVLHASPAKQEDDASRAINIAQILLGSDVAIEVALPSAGGNSFI